MRDMTAERFFRCEYIGHGCAQSKAVLAPVPQEMRGVRPDQGVVVEKEWL